MAEKLMPCPFCGSSDTREHSGLGVICDFCQSEACIGWWNRRKPGPATAKILEWAKAALRMPDYELVQQQRDMMAAFIAEHDTGGQGG